MHLCTKESILKVRTTTSNYNYFFYFIILAPFIRGVDYVNVYVCVRVYTFKTIRW